ncbi:MotA/TolQ/ExbB proton channel family protein [candidate division WOR-3 bacterium]|nr:MotA/TolQ/ExbB proton channel family protein [candidate division WOR-3 bacterium]
MRGLIEWYLNGGPFMWPILIAAVIGIAYIIERFITFARAGVDPKKFTENVVKKLKKGGVDAALKFCKASRSPIARILEPTLLKYKEVGKDKAILEEALSAAATTELAFLDRGMAVLSAVTTLSPMLGFLGTVSGMIRAFNAIALAGTVEPTLVASGISEALITTQFGLIVAVPTAAAHTYFSQKVNAYARSMEEAASLIIETLMEA